MFSRQSYERGAAAVEFALVFVMLATMLLAIVEGGILMMHQASVSAAAREGARMMAITNKPGSSTDAAQAAYPFGSLTTVDISPPDPCPAPPDRSTSVTVTVTATPTFSLGIFGSTTLTGVGAMRCGG